MILVDTSVWVKVLRDDVHRAALEAALAGGDPALTRFTQLELLQGTRDEAEWDLLARYLEVQDYLELGEESWGAAGRIHFDLYRRGITSTSPIDCCIAQVALDHDVLLLHDGAQFEAIAQVRDLRQRRLRL